MHLRSSVNRLPDCAGNCMNRGEKARHTKPATQKRLTGMGYKIADEHAPRIVRIMARLTLLVHGADREGFVVRWVRIKQVMYVPDILAAEEGESAVLLSNTDQKSKITWYRLIPLLM